MLKDLTPILYTKDTEGTIKFWVEAFEFTVESSMPETGWVSLVCDKTRVMFQHAIPPEPFEKPVMTGSLYFGTDAVDDLWERLKDKAEVCYPPENFYYGMREFALYDNNHYVVQFGQDINTLKQ
jgi:uncharacterized glyoxalase superfamily protein PhnB